MRCGGRTTASAFFFPPAPPDFSAGRPDYRVQPPPTFLAREGLRPAFCEKPHSLITAPPSARLWRIRCRRVLGLRFTRGPSAASAARSGGGSFCSSPARSALSAFASAALPLVLRYPSQRDLSPLHDTRGVRKSASRPQTGNRPGGKA